LIIYRSLLNREISDYPINVRQKSDPKYCEEYTSMIIFDVNISEYKDMIAEKLGMCHATYNVGVQESGEATANDLIATIRNKITQLYK
jgi:hypothetical protein